MSQAPPEYSEQPAYSNSHGRFQADGALRTCLLVAPPCPAKPN
ncbi:hypothetical protein [Pseudomonas chlororaphis]|jgi:hypothetical protein|nr:hypothetical protein [Pseudomonas chlororaphis]MCP1479228.1 hypothetical protein [Pseudomonas chlororaphis]MCP1594420.1 hypothetical protein [Pseudomonas chlororaphis]WDG53735.1 hypothetical protein PUP76_28380 [Pseudomonas chlororaphis]WDH91064.1 hypothetical protein PUP74_13805 [Pseudomonas chlororaphis]